MSASDLNKSNKFKDYISELTSSKTYDTLQVDYSTELEFNNKTSKLKLADIELSVFHLNIRSLNANQDGLVQLLMSLKLHFDIVVLSEIWSYNVNFYQNLLPGYTLYYDLLVLM